jgi:hypothetical protein
VLRQELLIVSPLLVTLQSCLTQFRRFGVLGPYWSEKFGKTSMKAFQGWSQHVGGCERNSVLYLERKGDGRVCINGENKIFGKGELFL